MNRGFSGGKRAREANRDLKKRQKAERLRRNRELRARGVDPDMMDVSVASETEALPEVRLEDVVIAVGPRPPRPDFGPTRLFVGGLGPATTTAELRSFFARFGEISDVVVLSDRGTGQSRGFGFVSYHSSAAADEAIRAANGVDLGGHLIRVNRAETRPGRS